MPTEICKDLNELNPLVKQQAELFLQKCKEQGLNIKITETYRSPERQKYLYCQGRTISEATSKGISKEFATKYCNPNAKKVTWTLNSNHMTRKAFDICQNIKGKEYDSVILAKAGAIAKTVGLDWGGDWKETPDTPHMENQNLKPIPSQANPVDPNKPSDWAKSSWDWCKENGFLDGTNPKGNVTREQMAIIIQRIIEHKR